MIKKALLAAAFAALLMLYACKPVIPYKRLYGKWNYVKVENPNMNPPDSVSRSELQENKPYIVFTKNNELMIYWGGKELSHGTFTLEGANIHYDEVLIDGKIRKFPFWISKITDQEIVFETLGEEGSRVTARKENQ